MIEAKVIEKIRNVLIANATVKSFVQDKVYASHISSVDRPIYPAISITLLPGQARSNVPAMVNMVLQIDLWFPGDKYTSDMVAECYGAIRTALHNQDLSDATIGVTIYQFLEFGIGPLLWDEPTSCMHLPARYSAVTI